MSNNKNPLINLNGRIFSSIKSDLIPDDIDGTYEKQQNGLLLRKSTGEIIAFISNGLKRKESPFIVSATQIEETKQVRYSYCLCSLMERFFYTVNKGEFYSDKG